MSPDHWANVGSARQPNSPSTTLASITEANIGRHAWDELGTLGWASPNEFDECALVIQDSVGSTSGGNGDGVSAFVFVGGV